MFAKVVFGSTTWPRPVAVVVLLALIPVASAVPPLVALGLTVAVLTALIATEGALFTAVRQEVRHAE